jgi:hypothetical protein
VWRDHLFPGAERKARAKRKLLGTGFASTDRHVILPELTGSMTPSFDNPWTYTYVSAYHTIPWDRTYHTVKVQIPTVSAYLETPTTLYAPTLLASNNSLVEVSTTYTRPVPTESDPSPQQVNFVGAWNHSYAPRTGGNWKAMYEINQTFIDTYCQFQFGGEPAYTTYISGEFGQCWQAYILNCVTGNWEEMGLPVFVAEGAPNGGRYEKQLTGWSAYEGYFGPDDACDCVMTPSIQTHFIDTILSAYPTDNFSETTGVRTGQGCQNTHDTEFYYDENGYGNSHFVSGWNVTTNPLASPGCTQAP